MTSIYKIIKADLYRYEGLMGLGGLMKGFLRNPGFRYLFLFRLVSSLNKWSPLHLFLRILKRRYRFKYGFEIDKDATIGEGFYLTDHVGPVIIGPIVMGKHCNVAHGVTIGRAYKNGVLGRPTIGDRVWIGTGSVIVGKINIGSDVLIAPNAFINKDVPDCSLVIGNPAKIIPKMDPVKNYINFVPPLDP